MDPKKRSVGASERDEWLRAAWRALVAGGLDAKRLVFVDEMGTNTSLAPLYAWSRKGERALCSAPRNWGANVTLLASMSMRGMGPCLAVEGPTTREVFEAYLQSVLAPSLEPGQVVVMDNLSSHKGPRVRELVEERGCTLLYLPRPTLPRSQPHRRSVLEDKGPTARCRGAYPRGSHRSDGRSSRRGNWGRCSGLLRASRLPRSGPSAMTDALGAWVKEGTKKGRGC
jgi:DDE superfamily endonuclease